MQSNEERGMVRASLVGLALCDENGKKLNPSDSEVAGLSRKCCSAMSRIAETVMSMNHMRRIDIETLEKNSKPTAEPVSG